MINLVMALHCHQPVGNFDHVFQKAVDKCYRPILEILDVHSGISTGLHISGPLLEWMEKNQADCLELLSDMVKRGQIEMLSSGFFEPLLAGIPTMDAKDQLLMMNDYLNGRFGSKPSGFWLTERVWDPTLPLIIRETGLSYTIVDDTHLYYSGIKPDEIYGKYVTEKEGYKVNIMATPMIMRYLIPFKPVEDVIAHLRAQEEMGRDIALYGDDGEKFGLWPGTYEWVIQKGWLEKFFAAVEENHDWLKTTLPGDYVSSHSPLGRVYLPQASYEEMTEWALPPEQSHALEGIIGKLKNENLWDEWRPFVRGGVWDNFLVKYDESNRMHKKMMFLSEQTGNNAKAKDCIWRAQCNCAYWHGVFGGLYLGHLRRAVQENLIKAQACLMEGKSEIELIHHDIDKDDHDEIIISNNKLSVGITPGKGGGIFDISFFPLFYNLSDVLTRRLEAYHYNIGTEKIDDPSGGDGISSIHDLAQGNVEDLKKLLIYDNYSRISLLDHLLKTDTTLEMYARNTHSEKGGGFIKKEYKINNINRSSKKALIDISANGPAGESTLYINKIIQLSDKSEIVIDYIFNNTGKSSISTLYGCEFNLNMYSDQDPERYYFIPEAGNKRNISETGEELDLNRFELINRPDRLKVSFYFSSPLSVWFFPLMTVSKSEEGFEYTYQGSSLLFNFPLDIAEGQKKEFQIKLEIINLG